MPWQVLFYLIELDSLNWLFAVRGHVFTATLNQLAMTKWHPEMEGAGCR